MTQASAKLGDCYMWPMWLALAERHRKTMMRTPASQKHLVQFEKDTPLLSRIGTHHKIASWELEAVVNPSIADGIVRSRVKCLMSVWTSGS